MVLSGQNPPFGGVASKRRVQPQRTLCDQCSKDRSIMWITCRDCVRAEGVGAWEQEENDSFIGSSSQHSHQSFPKTGLPRREAAKGHDRAK